MTEQVSPTLNMIMIEGLMAKGMAMEDRATADRARIDTLENKVARLEHHFVTLDKQLGKQARRIEELEAAQARQGDGK